MDPAVVSSVTGLLSLLFQFGTAQISKCLKSKLCRRQAVVLSEGKSTLARNLVSLTNDDLHIVDCEEECLASLPDDKRKALTKLNMDKNFIQANRLLQVYVRDYVKNFEKEFAGSQVLYLVSNVALARFLNISPLLTFLAVPTSEFVDVIQSDMGQLEKLQFNQERSDALLKAGRSKNKVIGFASWDDLTNAIKKMYGLGTRL